MPATIAVYADWDGLGAPLRLGTLHARAGAGREIFEFEFAAAALADPAMETIHLDPRLGPFEGPQHPPQGQSVFGVFADASPDRWGRLLMQRRLERAKRAGEVPPATRLYESDFLLGVHDAFRSGALRFRLDDQGDFLDNRHGVAAPPFVQLRELEAASLALERDEGNAAAAVDDWLRMLIAPGGSLGGARPKASVVDPDGHLWIAKFPSVRDEHNVGAWELVVHTLAQACGLEVATALAQQFANPHHTFLVRRFDRTETGRRLHFASAMTLTGRQDGDDASTGASYLEIARVLMDHGAQTDADLRELWSRIVFNMLVSNTDDHLRNHGFILVPGKGWRLSEAYDMNPVPDAHGLKLNVSESDNALDLDLARSVAHIFRLKQEAAGEIISSFQAVVAQWPAVAAGLQIPRREQERLAPAFRLAADEQS
ncbi:type II toxin-antitoxin system HipA family toxin [Variovorax paradoxus]|uniref:Putative DNA-binding transcriptional regulator n=1 Tax=Variovorax paradoxus TaxID=34073 RepID=A0A0H2LT97_VARPD|nr:HipA domain-containing protein [Variovorax paradoxus]KLN53493.1 putative DNA-binding transcriptional regulator [Variovorax paradoxus]